MNKFIQELSKKYDIEIPFSVESMKGVNSYSLDQDGNIKALFLNGLTLKSLDMFLPISDKLEVLSLEDCSVEYIDSLSSFSYLKKLNLSENPLNQSELENLVQLPNLIELDLSMTQILDTSVLGVLSSLIRLDLNFNTKLYEIKGLEGLSSLQHLDLEFSRIDNFSKIEVNENIQSMNFSSVSVTQILGLEKYSNLKSLDLSGSKISKMEGLDHLLELRRLFLSSNQIERIKGLSKLTNLETLDLSMNEIKKIEGLESLINLKELSLRDNKLSVVENLDNLNSLEQLLLDTNKIHKFDSGFLNDLKSECYVSIEPSIRKRLGDGIPSNIIFESEFGGIQFL